MKVINALYEIAQDNKNINIKTNAFFRKLTENISYNELIKGLNSEVEIIFKTSEDKKIEKLEQHFLNSNYIKLVDKINEIIDKVNKL